MPTLYRRDDCPLCDHAAEALSGAGLEAYAVEDIGWEGALADRFGTRIPVLVGDDGRELDWPFDPWTVRKFLAAD